MTFNRKSEDIVKGIMNNEGNKLSLCWSCSDECCDIKMNIFHLKKDYKIRTIVYMKSYHYIEF